MRKLVRLESNEKLSRFHPLWLSDKIDEFSLIWLYLLLSTEARKCVVVGGLR